MGLIKLDEFVENFIKKNELNIDEILKAKMTEVVDVDYEIKSKTNPMAKFLKENNEAKKLRNKYKNYFFLTKFVKSGDVGAVNYAKKFEKLKKEHYPLLIHLRYGTPKGMVEQYINAIDKVNEK